jgi:hypothetical protein
MLAEMEKEIQKTVKQVNRDKGWISINNKRQRVLSEISNMIVIKLKNPQLAPNDIHKD